MTPEEILAKQADIEERERRLAAEQASFAAGQQTALETENAAFVETIVTEGRLLPTFQAQVVGVLNALPSDAEVSFAGETGAETKQPAADALKDLLRSLPVQVDFGAADLGTAPGSGTTASFAADGKDFDTSQLEIDAKARAYMNEHSGVDYVTAVQAVS